jgi:hypothetical protein
MIVGKEFPDRRLCGFMYTAYLHPPRNGLPGMEPNLTLMPIFFDYGFQLYRSSTRENWTGVIGTWGELVKKHGFEVYSYDLPISPMMRNGIITPPAPDLLNFIYSHWAGWGYKGAYMYGNPVWPVFGPGNYALAKLFWNPDLDANMVVQDYNRLVYGRKAAKYIEELYNLLDTAYAGFMNRHPDRHYNLTEDHLQEIYAPLCPELEGYYLKAFNVRKEAQQQERLELFGQVLSIMQWYLREHGLLTQDYSSPLTRSAEEIDSLITNQKEDRQITTTRTRLPPEQPFEVEAMPPLTGAAERGTQGIPVFRKLRMLLYVPSSGEVSVEVKAFEDGYRVPTECVRYTLTDAEDNPVKAGVVAGGRTIRFSPLKILAVRQQ